ncbi:LysR substrate-binding domain-containing protein [Paraburkholderia sp. J12]|uniref:LysR substrate-binding domain-containing protein n=1 Tax=Paraburkholderia sp. J12 TaxID=2805432 RepID=UPI002ABD3F18|nr:LysR substrate-binding domain-containing protein [Paraburkholderia sp. J12]
MRLNHFRDMVAIVEHGSLRAAARHLGMAQPVLTRSIRSLERELGVVLFEREARGMTLTALGRLFYQRASAVVNEVQRAQDELAQNQGDAGGTLVAGLSIMPHVGMLPHALSRFRQRYPLVRLQLIEGLFPDVEAALRNGQIDFYLGAAPRVPPAPGLTTERLFENTRAVVARRGHPLSAAKRFKDLAGAEWATTSVDYNAEADLQSLFARYRLGEPRVMLKTRSALSMMVGLAHSDLLALLPVQWGEFPLTRDALALIPIKERLPAPPIVLIRRSGLPLTPAAEYFCDVMRRYAPDTAATPPAPNSSGRTT